MADYVIGGERGEVHNCSFVMSQSKESAEYCEGKRSKHSEERGSRKMESHIFACAGGGA